MDKSLRRKKRPRREDVIANEEAELREQGIIASDGNLAGEEPAPKATNGSGDEDVGVEENFDFLSSRKKEKPPWPERVKLFCAHVFGLLGELLSALSSFFDRVCLNIGLFAQGGMRNLYSQCSETVLRHRSGLGWLLVIGLCLDTTFLFFGWRSIIKGDYVSGAIACSWAFVMLNIDRYLLRSLDGMQKPAWWLLAARLMLMVLVVSINVMFFLVALLGDSIDKYTAEKNNAAMASINDEIVKVQDEFEKWKDGQLNYQAQLSIDIKNTSNDCLNEAHRGKWTGKPGFGPRTNGCLEELRKKEESLQAITAAYYAESARREAALKEKKTLLLSKLQDTREEQSIGDGLFGRVFKAIEVSQEMSRQQPFMMVVFSALDLIIFTLLILPFLSKLRKKEPDEYDVAFERSMRGKVNALLKQADEQREKEEAERRRKADEAERARKEAEVTNLEEQVALGRQRDDLNSTLTKMKLRRLRREQLEKMIEKAIQEENFEEANRLMAELESLEPEPISTPTPEEKF